MSTSQWPRPTAENLTPEKIIAFRKLQQEYMAANRSVYSAHLCLVSSSFGVCIYFKIFFWLSICYNFILHKVALTITVYFKWKITLFPLIISDSFLQDTHLKESGNLVSDSCHRWRWMLSDNHGCPAFWYCPLQICWLAFIALLGGVWASVRHTCIQIP